MRQPIKMVFIEDTDYVVVHDNKHMLYFNVIIIQLITTTLTITHIKYNTLLLKFFRVTLI